MILLSANGNSPFMVWLFVIGPCMSHVIPPQIAEEGSLNFPWNHVLVAAGWLGDRDVLSLAKNSQMDTFTLLFSIPP